MQFSNLKFIFSTEEIEQPMKDLLLLYDQLDDEEAAVFQEKYPNLNQFIDLLISTNLFDPNLKKQKWTA